MFGKKKKKRYCNNIVSTADASNPRLVGVGQRG